ncbi:MAG: type II toxin-antitoxin system Phd/YefM family antitoxin [Acidimicrobiia bacterium]
MPGIREVKSNLSDYVARAARGEEIVVTDRNRPVARLVPYVATSDVERGIDEGWIEAPRRVGLGPVERARSGRSTIEVLDEDRG